MAAYCTRPYLLLLLPVMLTALALLARGSYAGLSRARWWLALALRAIVATLLVLAAADLHLGKRDKRLSVLFVVDTSRSVLPEQRAVAARFVQAALNAKPAKASAGVVLAAGQAELSAPLSDAVVKVTVSPVQQDGFTDLGNALRLAVAALPAGGARRGVLLSDGNENEGDVRSEALAAREAGVAVDTVPLKSTVTGEAFVESLDVSGQVKEGEPVEVRVTVDSQLATDAELHLVTEGRRIKHRRVSLQKGKNIFTMTTSFGSAGFHEVQAIVEPIRDESAENNQAAGFTLVKGKSKVLYAEGDPQQAPILAKALRAQGVDVEVCLGATLPESLLELQQHDAVILSDIPAPVLSEAQMRMLKSAVRDAGIGLVMIGGHDSFAMGGYFDTPVEDALPVKMEVKHKRLSQRTAVVIAIDKSGSMGCLENGVAKYLLANEAACATAKLLSRIDSIGVIATDSVARAVVPLQKAENKQAICDMIATIRPGGGGIYCRVSLELAAQMLSGSPTGARHLILLADGADSEQQEGCYPLTQQVAAGGITVSCVAIGDGQDVPFLKRVAELGKGRFYLTNLAASLPRIFAKETAMAMRTQMVEEPFLPVVSAPSDILRGIDATPQLLGYVATTPKSLATVSLVSHQKDPVLATWQYGLGRSVAFTSSCKTGWGVYWVKWSGYGKFWSQLVRWVMRRSPAADFDSRVVWEGDKGRIVVDAVDKDGNFRNFEKFRASVATPTGEGEAVALKQTAPGRYEGMFGRRGIGSYVVTVRGGKSGNETYTSGVSVPYAPDLRDLAPNVPLMREVASLGGGRVLKEPRDAFRPGTLSTVTATSLAPLLVLLAMVLFVLDVAVRRLMIEPAAVVAAVVGVLVRWRERRRAQTVSDDGMARLLRRKTEAVESVKPVEVGGTFVTSPPPPPSPATAPEPAPFPQPKPEPVVPAEEDEPRDTLSRLKRAKESARRR
ncbi:MAG: hypothetical protein CO096_23900 [Armatimonadetes bacterium CG_4_9_14_3_um_filter_66_14]|nr:MAG: hypothetical protein CO096_23900 [Armatimonadetes bacterium CG_4_9_14_3_um_filter_66_14]